MDLLSDFFLAKAAFIGIVLLLKLCIVKLVIESGNIPFSKI